MLYLNHRPTKPHLGFSLYDFTYLTIYLLYLLLICLVYHTSHHTDFLLPLRPTLRNRATDNSSLQLSPEPPPFNNTQAPCAHPISFPRSFPGHHIEHMYFTFDR